VSGWRLAGRLLLLVLYVVAGLWLIIAPWTGTIALTTVLIAYLLVEGVIRLAVGWAERRVVPGSWMLVVAGLASIVLGLLIWADFPSSADWAIGLLFGINMLFWGWSLLAAAMVGRRLSRDVGATRPVVRTA
jgi:uncharacterized membrane protein HdeD (DUF308 family)